MSAIRIFNFPYEVSLAIFDYLHLQDYVPLKRLMTASSALVRYEIVDELVTCLLQCDIDAFRNSNKPQIQNYLQQAKVFMGTISTITLLSDSSEIELYNPKPTHPCLCKIGSAIIRETAPNFYRNSRSLYDYLQTRFHRSHAGEMCLAKSRKLSPEIKEEQFERLLQKYQVIKKVQDFDGLNWVERTA